jgi:hypothetical protein
VWQCGDTGKQFDDNETGCDKNIFKNVIKIKVFTRRFKIY